MLAKISLTAAFFLMAAPPMACASNRDAAAPTPISRHAHESQPGMVVAQDGQPSVGTTDNDSDSDSDSDSNDNDSDDSDSNDNDNANGNQNQTDQQNAAGDDQPVPPTIIDNGNDQGNSPQTQQFNQTPQPQQ